MPIRMVPDKNQNQKSAPPKTKKGNSSSSGSNILTALLPVVFSVIQKKPKLAIGIIVIGIVIYFIGGKEACSGNAAGFIHSFSTGSEFDLQKYDQTDVYEALADNKKNPIPNSVSLLQYAPRRLNQGQQGSCVGWSSSYAARTILQARMTGENPNNIAFSPSFLYNQIALEGCQGTYIKDAMKTLHTIGDLPFSNFAYNEKSCANQPNQSQKQAASAFKIKGYNRLTLDGNNYKADVLAIKQNLAQGAPVVVGMMVGGSFMQEMQGEKIWIPNQSDYNQRGFGGHAMCIIGYDDYLEGGAFQLMNSWGPSWGEEGVAWVRYNDFEYFTKEAYGLYPMGNSDKSNETKLNVSFGIVDNKTGKNIPFIKTGDISFRTSLAIKKGTEFKIESTNSIECYTYVFGQETDGSSYVLFPYTAKHSPYCGITGTRLFPKDHSLKADDFGARDYMAILVTKEPIDYEVINKKISQTSGATYAEKIQRALKNELILDTKFNTSSNTINISCDTKGKNMLAVVLEVDKK